MARNLFSYQPYQYVRELIEREQLLQHVPIERRYRLKDMQNPFHYYEDKEFEMRFRFPKETVIDLIKIIYPNEEADKETRGK